MKLWLFDPLNRITNEFLMAEISKDPADEKDHTVFRLFTKLMNTFKNYKNFRPDLIVLAGVPKDLYELTLLMGHLAWTRNDTRLVYAAGVMTFEELHAIISHRFTPLVAWPETDLVDLCFEADSDLSRPDRPTLQLEDRSGL